MSDIAWTKEEIERFDELVEMVSSRSQVERVMGRIDMNNFVKEHGKEKCDAMWAYLESKP